MDNAGDNLGGLNINPASGSSGNTSADNISASANVIKQRKQRSDVGQARGSRGGNNASGAPPISLQQFEKLYTPELWGRVLSSPADAALALTGNKTWELSADEKKTLGETGSVAAQCMAVTDPRYLAVCLALVAVIDVYGIRLAKVYADKKAAEKNKATVIPIKSVQE